MKSNTAKVSVDLAIILLVQATFLLATFFNLMLLRQLLGLVLLTFVSGFLIVRLMKLDRLGLAATVLLSVGLSVSFDMFLGLLANFLLPLAGINRPLDEFPVLVVFNLSFVLLILLATQLRERKLRFDTKGIFSLPAFLFAVFLPALGIAG
ncbi:MAG: hypothetical protein WCD81_00560, partial [Candidatus Bathyarchaeia archaeon]